MEQKKEAVYLINDERYLHLRENGAGVGFATYNKVTGEPLESGQISEKNLPPDGRNAIPAARNWYLFELSDDDRKVIQQESVKILENIPQAGIGGGASGSLKRCRRIFVSSTATMMTSIAFQMAA